MREPLSNACGRLGNANCRDHFVGRSILQTKSPTNVPANFPTELQSSQIGSVVSSALFQRIDRRFSNVPRCGEVRLANAERYDIVHRGYELEEVPDPRSRKSRYVLRDKTFLRWLHDSRLSHSSGGNFEAFFILFQMLDMKPLLLVSP
mgnify:CR=1 FL=1